MCELHACVSCTQNPAACLQKLQTCKQQGAYQSSGHRASTVLQAGTASMLEMPGSLDREGSQHALWDSPHVCVCVFVCVLCRYVVSCRCAATTSVRTATRQPHHTHTSTNRHRVPAKTDHHECDTEGNGLCRKQKTVYHTTTRRASEWLRRCTHASTRACNAWAQGTCLYLCVLVWVRTITCKAEQSY